MPLLLPIMVLHITHWYYLSAAAAQAPSLPLSCEGRHTLPSSNDPSYIFVGRANVVRPLAPVPVGRFTQVLPLAVARPRSLRRGISGTFFIDEEYMSRHFRVYWRQVRDAFGWTSRVETLTTPSRHRYCIQTYAKGREFFCFF